MQNHAGTLADDMIYMWEKSYDIGVGWINFGNNGRNCRG